MKCMCAQTRPRFILSSERVFWGMEFEPKLTPREKSPLPENFPRGGSNPRCCGQRAQTLPTSYSGPRKRQFDFHPLFTIRNALNLCIYETEFSHFLPGVGLGVKVFTTATRTFRVKHSSAGIAQLVVLGLAVHSVAGSILLWGHFPVEGIFPLKLTWVQTPFPLKLLRMRA